MKLIVCFHLSKIRKLSYNKKFNSVLQTNASKYFFRIIIALALKWVMPHKSDLQYKTPSRHYEGIMKVLLKN